MRALTGTAHTKSVAGLVPRAVRRAHDIATGAVPELPWLAVVEFHRQVPALVLIRANFILGEPDQDAFFLEGSIVVAEPEAVIGDVG